MSVTYTIGPALARFPSSQLAPSRSCSRWQSNRTNYRRPTWSKSTLQRRWEPLADCCGYFHQWNLPSVHIWWHSSLLEMLSIVWPGVTMLQSASLGNWRKMSTDWESQSLGKVKNIPPNPTAFAFLLLTIKTRVGATVTGTVSLIKVGHMTFLKLINQKLVKTSAVEKHSLSVLKRGLPNCMQVWR